MKLVEEYKDLHAELEALLASRTGIFDEWSGAKEPVHTQSDFLTERVDLDIHLWDKIGELESLAVEEHEHIVALERRNSALEELVRELQEREVELTALITERVAVEDAAEEKLETLLSHIDDMVVPPSRSPCHGCEGLKQHNSELLAVIEDKLARDARHENQLLDVLSVLESKTDGESLDAVQSLARGVRVLGAEKDAEFLRGKLSALQDEMHELRESLGHAPDSPEGKRLKKIERLEKQQSGLLDNIDELLKITSSSVHASHVLFDREVAVETEAVMTLLGEQSMLQERVNELVDLNVETLHSCRVVSELEVVQTAHDVSVEYEHLLVGKDEEIEMLHAFSREASVDHQLSFDLWKSSVLGSESASSDPFERGSIDGDDLSFEAPYPRMKTSSPSPRSKT